MQKKLPSRPMLFLMEMLITLLLFSITSAVCVQFFLKAHQLNTQAQQLNHGVFICENAAEIYRSGDGSFDSLLTQYPTGFVCENIFSLFYDENYEICDTVNAAYQLEVITAREEYSHYADIFFRRIETHTTIYRLHLVHHLPRQDDTLS